MELGGREKRRKKWTTIVITCLLNIKLQQKRRDGTRNIDKKHSKRAFKRKFRGVREKISFMKQGQRNFSFLSLLCLLSPGPVFFMFIRFNSAILIGKVFFCVSRSLVLSFLHMLFFLSFYLRVYNTVFIVTLLFIRVWYESKHSVEESNFIDVFLSLNREKVEKQKPIGERSLQMSSLLIEFSFNYLLVE